MSNRDKTLNIWERMSRISSELSPINKDLEVTKGPNGKSYSAISEAAILKAIKPLEEKYGVYSYAVDRTREVRSIKKEFIRDGRPVQISYMVELVSSRYRFVNIDNPDQFVETIGYGTGIDSGDKAPGKAMTYADKYAIMKAYKIEGSAETDPDANASPEDGFILGDLEVPAQPENPMIPQAAEPDPAPVAEPVAPAPAAKAPEQSQGMTLEQAQNIVLTRGAHAGKTMGAMLAIDPSMVHYYAERYTGRNKDLAEAAKILLEHKASLAAAQS